MYTPSTTEANLLRRIQYAIKEKRGKRNGDLVVLRLQLLVDGEGQTLLIVDDNDRAERIGVIDR